MHGYRDHRLVQDDPVLRRRLAREQRLAVQPQVHAALDVAGPGVEPGGRRPEGRCRVDRGRHPHLGARRDVLGAAATVSDPPPYDLSDVQRLYLFSRSDTIYGGSNQIQRNVIGERVLGLPKG